jgi:general nucleoside transport system permease protein
MIALQFAASGGGIFSEAVITSLIAGGILAGVPLMFTALGETISERAGVLNLGLEGMMLLGAYIGFVGAFYLHSQALGFVFGMLGGMIGGSLMVMLCVWLGLDQIVVGIAITLAGEGITSVLDGAQFGSQFPRLGAPSTVAIPGLEKIPIIGPSLFDQPLVVYLGLLFTVFLVWMFRATNIGLNLRAAGEKPEALDAAGISVTATRSWAALSTGALAGLGGAYLSIVGAGVFTPFMTQGQGFMAIVIAMLARGKPGWVVAGAFLFGICLSIATALQLAGINISTDLVNMLPFIAIMAALLIFGRRSYLPPALAVPYVRGAR